MRDCEGIKGGLSGLLDPDPELCFLAGRKPSQDNSRVPCLLSLSCPFLCGPSCSIPRFISLSLLPRFLPGDGVSGSCLGVGVPFQNSGCLHSPLSVASLLLYIFDGMTTTQHMYSFYCGCIFSFFLVVP